MVRPLLLFPFNGTSREAVGVVVVVAVSRLLGRPELSPAFTAPRPGDVQALHADTRRARELPGYEAVLSFEEGLRLYLDWFRHTHPVPAVLLESDVVNGELPS